MKPGESKAKLTKRTVDAAQPADKRYYLWDSEMTGFGLRIEPTGKKIYALKYRHEGQQKMLTIGAHGAPWTPELARQEADKLLRAVRVEKRDPAREKKAAREMPTIAGLCDLYLAEGCAHKKPKTIAADRARIEHHIKPLLGRVKVDALAKGDVNKLFMSVRDGKTAGEKDGARKQGRIVVTGGEGVAKQCVMLLSTLMSFAIDQGLRTDNPAKGFKKPKGKAMERFLSPAELARLGDALAEEVEATANPYPAAAIRLLAFTGCRRDEIEKLKWSYADIERRQLRLPDSKTGAKTVYLSAPALVLLEELASFAGDSPYVIQGKPAKDADGQPVYKPFNGMGKLWERVRKRAGLEDVRLHDLRHSFASVGVGGANLGLPIVGALLGHRNASTTQKYAHLGSNPLQEAADAIGGQIAAAMGGAKGNVVPLRRVVG